MHNDTVRAKYVAYIWCLTQWFKVSRYPFPFNDTNFEVSEKQHRKTFWKIFSKFIMPQVKQKSKKKVDSGPKKSKKFFMYLWCSKDINFNCIQKWATADFLLQIFWFIMPQSETNSGNIQLGTKGVTPQLWLWVVLQMIKLACSSQDSQSLWASAAFQWYYQILSNKIGKSWTYSLRSEARNFYAI